VAVLITKALIEIPPKFAGLPPVHPRQDKELFASEWKGAAGLAEDVRYYGQWMRDEAEKRIGHLYPKGPNGETIIAWLWVRTVKCPNPACGAHMPLLRSFVLSKKNGKETWIEPKIDKETRRIQFSVRSGKGKAPPPPKQGRGATFQCLVCRQVAEEKYIKSEGVAGRMWSELLAVVTDAVGGRTYRGPTREQEEVASSAQPEWEPTYELAGDKRAIWCPLYGLDTFDKLFTRRQLVTMGAVTNLVIETGSKVHHDAIAYGLIDPQAKAYAAAITMYLGIVASKATAFNNALARWRPGEDKSAPAFGRQGIPMVWDYAEVNPFAGAGGDLGGIVDGTVKTLLGLPASGIGDVRQLDVMAAVMPVANPTISTDPPYYDNIGYADLADFFYVWLRRSLGRTFPDLFSTVLVPKTQELVAVPYRFDNNKEKAKSFFEAGLGRAFDSIHEVQNVGLPLTIYYAFKQSESDDNERSNQNTTHASTGWETMLEGLLKAGFAITGTWPLRTEMGTRQVAMGVGALASSILLVCRPRPESAPLATRREFVAALKKELPAALIKLTHGGIAPVDLAQASIGPGMAVFSRYAKVLEADGTPMGVRTALQIINQELDEYLSAEEGDLDRETRFALAWFQQFGNGDGAFGEADVLARAKDTAVEAMVRAGILHSRAGKVRLLRRGELDEDWDPRVDARLTVWECAQQLIRRLNETGEAGAARLLKQLGGGRGEDARALAYRLYAICERKKWADEALAYNALVVSWPEIEKKAAGMEGQVEQGRLL
jgi:putative DNA methylase